jgi:hypothetical protein
MLLALECDHADGSLPQSSLLFLRRNLKIPSIRIKEQAYQTLVRPLVEYASTVWNPYTKTEINKIEAVQRRVDRDSSVDGFKNNLMYKEIFN